MGKGDKIKESKLVCLLFSQVSTFSIFLTFQFFLLSEGHMRQKNGGRQHGGSPFWLESSRISQIGEYWLMAESSRNRPKPSLFLTPKTLHKQNLPFLPTTTIRTRFIPNSFALFFFFFFCCLVKF